MSRLNLVVRLSDIEDIQRFVRKCSELDCELDLIAGRYVVDAKSILGVCSVDLKRELQLNAYTDDAKDVELQLRDFVVC